MKPGYGDRHPYFAAAYYSVGSVLLMMGNLEAAAPAIARSMQLHRKLLEPGHPDLLRAATLHGMFLHRRGDLAAAEAELRQTESLGRKTFNEQHPDLAETRAALAACRMDARKFDEAEKAAVDRLGSASEIPRRNPSVGPTRRHTAGSVIQLDRSVQAGKRLASPCRIGPVDSITSRPVRATYPPRQPRPSRQNEVANCSAASHTTG